MIRHGTLCSNKLITRKTLLLFIQQKRKEKEGRNGFGKLQLLQNICFTIQFDTDSEDN